MEENTEKVSEKPKKRLRLGRIILLILMIAIIALVFYAYRNPSLFSKTSKSDAAAIVNADAISMAELDARYAQVPEVYRPYVTKASVLDQLITEKVLLQEAESLGIFASQEEVEEEIKGLMKETNQSAEEFEASLNEQGYSYIDFKDYFQKQLTMSKLLNQTLLNELQVSDSEAKSYYQENIDQFLSNPGQIRARHILVDTEKEAKDLIVKLGKGEDFAELAKAYSKDATSSNGGELGFSARSDMVKEFADAAFNLKVGEYTKLPVKTQFGYHLIKRESDKLTFDEANADIKAALLLRKQKTAVGVYIEQVRNNSTIELIYKEEEPSEEEGPVQEVETLEQKPAEEPVASEADSQKQSQELSCPEKFGLSKGTVIFYYLDSDKCPQCKTMLPIVESLEGQGFSFYYADIADKATLEVIDACFKDKVEGKAPLFICSSTSVAKLGTYSEEKLMDFAESCI